MRISDWSSDVCSSDLPARPVHAQAVRPLLCQQAGGRHGEQLGSDQASEVLRLVIRREELRMVVARVCPLRPRGGLDSEHPREPTRSEEHTSELQSLMRISYAVFCLKKKKNNNNETIRIKEV